MGLNDFLSGIKGSLGVGFKNFRLHTSGGGEPLVVPVVRKDDPTDGSVENPMTAGEKWMADVIAATPDVEPTLPPEAESGLNIDNMGTHQLEREFGMKLRKPDRQGGSQ